MYLFLTLGRYHTPMCPIDSIIKNIISFNQEYLSLIKPNEIFLSMLLNLSSYSNIEKINKIT